MLKIKNNFLIKIIIMIALISSCSHNKKINKNYNENIKNFNKFQEFTDNKKNNYMASLDSSNCNKTKLYSKCVKKDIKVQNMKIDGIANVLSKVYKVNIGSASQQNDNLVFSFDYKNVCLDYILDSLIDRYNIGNDKTSTGYTIYSPQIMSKIFNLSYHNFNRSATSSVNISSSGGNRDNLSVNGNSSIKTTIEDNFWKNVINGIKVIIEKEQDKDNTILQYSTNDIDDQRFISVDSENGIIIVKAMPRALRKVDQFIENIKKNCLKQIVIEAKILEVTLTDEFNYGINWGLLGEKIGNFTNNFGFNSMNNNNGSQSDTSLVSGVFSGEFKMGGADNNNFQALISMLSSQGNVSVLSSPKISALNNQRAMIKFGTDQYYIISSASTVGQTTTNAQGNVSVQQGNSFSSQTFFSGIALDATPTITRDGEIVMHIHPVITRVTKDQQNIKLNGQDNSLVFPKIDSREADTVVKAKSGDIIIIGGLTQNFAELEQTGPSGSKKIASIFGRQKKHSQKTELIILLRPVIVDKYKIDESVKDKYLIDENITGY